LERRRSKSDVTEIEKFIQAKEKRPSSRGEERKRTPNEEKMHRIKRELRELRISYQALSENHESTSKQLKLLQELEVNNKQDVKSLAAFTETDIIELSLDDLENLRETCVKLLTFTIKREKEVIKLQKKEAKELNDCKVCLDREINTVILDCGHHCICETCGIDMRNCPMCSKPINKIVKIYKS